MAISWNVRKTCLRTVPNRPFFFLEVGSCFEDHQDSIQAGERIRAGVPAHRSEACGIRSPQQRKNGTSGTTPRDARCRSSTLIVVQATLDRFPAIVFLPLLFTS